MGQARPIASDQILPQGWGWGTGGEVLLPCSRRFPFGSPAVGPVPVPAAAGDKVLPLPQDPSVGLPTLGATGGVRGDMRVGQGTCHPGPRCVLLTFCGVPHCRGLARRTHDRGGCVCLGGHRVAVGTPPASFSPPKAGDRKLNREPELRLGDSAVVTWHWAKNTRGGRPQGRGGSRGPQLGYGDRLELCRGPLSAGTGDAGTAPVGCDPPRLRWGFLLGSWDHHGVPPWGSLCLGLRRVCPLHPTPVRPGQS